MTKREKRHRRKVNFLKENQRLKGESWKYFEDFLNKKALSTQEEYLRYLIGFLEWIDTDTERLYDLYLRMIRDEDPRKVKKMGKKVSDYQNYLIEAKGIKGVTTKNSFLAIKGFFTANELPFKVKKKTLDDSEELPSISIEQISKVLSATGSYKVKAFILFARDSGMRTGDITHLPIRVVRAALNDPSLEFHTFEWRQGKTGKMANPVLGPDCLEAIREWMNYRVEVLKISVEDGDPLFCIEKTRVGYTNKLGMEVMRCKKGEWMDDGNMSSIFRHLVNKANLKPLLGGTRLPSIHSLRKHHKTILEYAGVPTSWVNKMQGRKGEGTGGIYTKPNPEELIEMFKKGYSALSGIEKSQQEKVDKLTHELGLSQYEMTELRAERDKYRAGYELRTRLQSIIDKARLDGDLPEEIIKKLEEKLESVETFKEGVFEFHKLEREFELEEERSENWDFKMVDEEVEMILNARDGWEVFKALNDGRYLLRRHL